MEIAKGIAKRLLQDFREQEAAIAYAAQVVARAKREGEKETKRTYHAVIQALGKEEKPLDKGTLSE